LSRFWQFQHWNLVFSHSSHLDSTVAIRALRHNTASCRIHIVKIDQTANNVEAAAALPVRRGTSRNSNAPLTTTNTSLDISTLLNRLMVQKKCC
jgi:hypothetical protein